MLNGLDLFSGIGGISIALSDWIRPIAYCEIDPYCQGVLLSRIATNEIKPAPIWDDIRSFNGEGIKGDVDIVYGGFPCQDISVAGHGKGLAGERSGLFWEIHRLAKEIFPKFIFLENVPAITSRGGITIVRSLAEMGYDCRWCVISAASIGALHRRERWFLLAHSNSSRGGAITTGHKLSSESEKLQHAYKKAYSSYSETMGADVANIMRKRFSVGQTERSQTKSTEYESWWALEPDVGRVADGVPQRVVRLRALGNAVVPSQAREAFRILSGLA